jgi:methionyl-tRNA formyltransferase
VRLAFLGSPAPAATCLAALAGAGHDITLVVTEPDRRRGRGGALSPTPVKEVALQLGIPVSERVADVTGSSAELGVVVAFGRLIRPQVLAEIAMVNLHFSLLPRWRGAAPVERAILAGDRETGVCLMHLEEGLDTGPVYACEKTPIFESETAESLRERLAVMGAGLLVQRLAGGASTLGVPEPQEGEATYAAKIKPEELLIDWSRSARDISRLVRIGRAWTTFRGARLIVWEARVADDERQEPGSLLLGPEGEPVVSTGEGGLQLIAVQPEGRQRQDAASWARGVRLGPSDRLDRPAEG